MAAIATAAAITRVAVTKAAYTNAIKTAHIEMTKAAVIKTIYGVLLPPLPLPQLHSYASS